jgi:dihydrofolate reductase
MPKSTRTTWRYVAIPAELADRITVIVERDRYPNGQWHSKDHFVIQAIKDKLACLEKSE